MSYIETDPLLPKNDLAPEILNSRPQSLRERNDTEDALGVDNVNKVRKAFVDILALLTVLVAVGFLVVLIFPDRFRIIWGEGPRSVEDRVNEILSQTPLIDGHNDLALLIRLLYNNHIYNENFTKPFTKGGMAGNVDLPRLKEGKVGGAFWSAYAPCPHNWADFSDESYIQAVAFTYNQIDVLARLQAAYPNSFTPPPNSSIALSSFRDGRLISPLAIEGLHQIGNSLSNLRNYYRLGVRYATLTHNCHNKYADAALSDLPGGVTRKATPYWGGISPAGREIVHEMNRMGMIVDLSHVSFDTMRDVLGKGDWPGSTAPPIFSHSSAYALCPHPRNVPDDILQLVKEKGGVVMINFVPEFISCVATDNENGLPEFYPHNSTLKHVVEHIMHIGNLIGYDYVGLGSDFDGIPTTPDGLDDVSKFPDLVAEMLRKGVSDRDAAKVVGGNILRVWKDVESVASRMQVHGETPKEDPLPDLRIRMFSNMVGFH